ncbi:hypothetical protein MKX07_000359 [Trichoderma sp. CBMAI-0711]|nr:hypothetical protein MKX07_000359 [Trichoderma sp. CBMAI-0711]
MAESETAVSSSLTEEETPFFTEETVTKIASASQDKTIKIWDPETGYCKATLQGHAGDVWTVAWEPDGKLLASGSADGTLKIWDSTTNACNFTLPHAAGVMCVSWSPDGTKLASASADGTLRLWVAETGECLATLKASNYDMPTLAWSPDGTRILTGSVDHTMRVWDILTGEYKGIPVGNTWTQVFGVGWSPDSKLFASGMDDKQVTIWDPATGERKLVLKGHVDTVKGVSWNPNGNILISASYDCKIKVWDPVTGYCNATLDGHGDWVNAVSWAPEGVKFASGSKDKTVRIWDTSINKCIRVLSGHTGPVYSLSDIEKDLEEKKTQFNKETQTEQAVLTSLGTDVETAVTKMKTDKRVYDAAQDQLIAKLREASVDAKSLDVLQQIYELTYLTLEESQNKVRYLQFREQALRRTEKSRASVQRAIARAETLMAAMKA